MTTFAAGLEPMPSAYADSFRQCDSALVLVGHSRAVSLKRIADALEAMQRRTILNTPDYDRGEA